MTTEIKPGKKRKLLSLKSLSDLFNVGPTIAISVVLGTIAIITTAVILFIRSAPQTSITFSSGPEGSVFQKNALKYKKILERNGVTLNVLTSEGSLQNLERLNTSSDHVDIGFVQSGIQGPDTTNLISLGSVSYQPLMIFYRGKEFELLSDLTGKKVAIGPIGSGVRNFATTLLAANGIKEGGSTKLLDWEADQASKELQAGKIDAVFIMSESASTDILHTLLRTDGIHLYSFKQANAYSRKIDFLNTLDLPEGAIDFGRNIPSHDITLLGPMVEVIASKRLHPALAELLMEAMVEVHSRPGIFQHRGDFPMAVEHTVHVSEDATRFYKSGKSLLYRFLPFWIASLTSRILVVFVPMLVILIPAMRSIPSFFRWRVQSKINRYYSQLLRLEKELGQYKFHNEGQLAQNFDRIEEAVNKMKLPASFADQYYGLRGHIDYVRLLVVKKKAG